MEYKPILFENIVSDIKKASRYFKSRVIRIVGGEPLLHNKLSDIIEICHKSKIANSIELWTNGILLKTSSKINWDLLDGIIISKYPEINYDWQSEDINKLAKKYKIWINIRNCDRFVWSLNLTRNSTKLANALFNNCRECSMDHTIRNGKIYKCVQSAFIQDRLKQNRINIIDDGLTLLSRPLKNINKIKRYMTRVTPLNACYYCFGDFGDDFMHQQYNSEGHTLSYNPKFNRNFFCEL